LQDQSAKFVAFGCLHASLHDQKAVDWLISTIATEKPDYVVCLGDLIEANAASQWDDAKELAIDLDDEYVAANEILSQVRKASPRADRWFIAGNHEANVVRAGRIDKRIRSRCDWLKGIPELHSWRVNRDYNYSRGRGCFSLGQVTFTHGYETARTKLAAEAIYFCLNSPFGLYVSAHTHRPERVSEIVWGELPMQRWRANVGCLRNLEPSYMERRHKWNWGHGLIVGEAKPLKSPRMSKEWDAEVRVLQMYDAAG